jgi:antitoxin VapB
MPISIRNPKTETLARAVARETGVSITEAITLALEERLQRVRGSRVAADLVSEMMEISGRCSSLPTLDTRTDGEILGYGSDGAPAPW